MAHYWTFTVTNSSFLIGADEELNLPKHVAIKGIGYAHPMSYLWWALTGPRPDLPQARKQDGENNAASSLYKDKYLRNYYIFEYNMIRPTSVSKEIHSHQTLGLPFHCLKLALVLGGKKEAGMHSKTNLSQHKFVILFLLIIRTCYKKLKYCILFWIAQAWLP